MPYIKKTKKRPSVTKRAKIIGVGSAAVAAVLAFGGLYLQQQETIDSNAAQASQFTPAPVAAETPTAAASESSAALGSLENTETPWTVAIVGDSTGNDVGEFVYLSFTALGEETGRPVIIHNWSVDTDTYISETVTSEGDGAPIVVWNGSAPGKGPSYSMEQLPTMLPERPDLLVVNHGHNTADAAQAVDGIRGITSYAHRAWDVTPQIMVTLQNPRLDSGSQLHDQIVERLRAVYAEKDATLVDVDRAFRAGTVENLLNDDGLHPSQEGGRLWADTFLQALPRS